MTSVTACPDTEAPSPQLRSPVFGSRSPHRRPVEGEEEPAADPQRGEGNPRSEQGSVWGPLGFGVDPSIFLSFVAHKKEPLYYLLMIIIGHVVSSSQRFLDAWSMGVLPSSQRTI